jgi:hypothetical protein
MAVCFIDGLGGLAQVMEVTQLVGDLGQSLGHGTSDGELAIPMEARVDEGAMGLVSLADEKL